MSLSFLLSRFCKKWPQLWLTGLVLWMAAGAAQAQDNAGFAAPAVAARAAVLMNPATGEILFAKEPHLQLPPASTTKVLTALVTLERLNLHTRVRVSPQAASAPPSRIGLRAGEAAMAQDLLYGLMLKSGNDAAETLAEAIGGSIGGFSQLMNQRAAQIGARNSHFMNPHGLPNDAHYSTAYDLALIFRQAMNHPLFADIVRTRSAALRIESGKGLYGDWRMVPVNNTNRLLASYEGARGGKTGFTFKARRCFVGEVDRGGIRLIVAILNSPNSGTMWEDARNLLDYGFARYGLAPPPPVKPESTPVMVRRAPTPKTPAAVQVAAVRSALAKGKRTAAVKPATRPPVKAVAAKASGKAKSSAKVAAAPAKKPSAAKKPEARTVARNSKPAPAAKPDNRRTTTKVAKAEPAPRQKPKRGG